jgi:hypothetical protein
VVYCSASLLRMFISLWYTQYILRVYICLWYTIGMYSAISLVKVFWLAVLSGCHLPRCNKKGARFIVWKSCWSSLFVRWFHFFFLHFLKIVIMTCVQVRPPLT